MAIPQVLQQMMQRPSMYFFPLEFDVAAAFIQGFDLAQGGGALLGFWEWLIVKLGDGNNLSWNALILQMAFPGNETSPREYLLHASGQERAVALLFSLLKEFWQVRESPQGLRRIYLGHQAWLQRQDWYCTSSSDFVSGFPTTDAP